jgi:ABC-type transport system substrate-binding protein
MEWKNMNIQKKKLITVIFLIVLSIQLLVTSVTAQEEEEETTYFKITFLVAADNEDLMKVAQLVENEMWRIGIDSQLIIQQNVRDRAFRNSRHLTYDEGGYDVLFYGWYDGLSAPSTLLQFFHSDKMMHGFGNFFPVSDRLLDRRLGLLGTSPDFDSRAQLVELILDQLIWQIHPMTSIYQEEEVFALDSELFGFDPVQMRLERVEFLDDQSTLAFAGLSLPTNVHPFFATTYDESLVTQQLFDGLMGADADYNFFPLIAKEAPQEKSGYNRVIRRNVDEGEGLLWDVKIRPDVYWHDGYGYSNETVGVDDVIFTYRTALNSQVRTSFQSIFQTIFGTNPSLAFQEIDNETVRFHLSESVRELSTLFQRKPQAIGAKPFFSDRFLDLPSVFALPIIPRHILDPVYDSTAEGIGLGGPGRTADGSTIPGYNEWRQDSDFNSGSRSEGFSGRAVIGNGPYQLDLYNSTNSSLELSSMPLYYKTTVDGEYSSRPQAIRFEFGHDKYDAQTMLVNGKIDILDSGFELFSDLVYLQSYPNVQIQKKRGWQMAGIAYNTFNPYLADPNVRLAISHLVPRQIIVDYVLGGLAHPSFAPLPDQSPYWSEQIPRIAYNLTKAWDFMEKAGYDMSELRERLGEKDTNQSSGAAIHISGVFFGILTVLFIRRKQRSNRAAQ